MLKRILYSKLLQEQKRGKSLLLLGPRQVGKSTILSLLHPDLIINLADEANFRSYLSDPALIRRQVSSLRSKSTILIDEVQRIPSILNSVQALIDERRERVFLLTGSSARKLKGGKANLLPGRMFIHRLFPMTYWELGSQFDLDRALTVGMLPEIYLNDYGADLISGYIDTYLREEIQAEALARNMGSYSRFLDLAAEVSGTIVNYSQLASDSEIPKETLRRYYDILTDTLIVYRMRGFTDIKGNRKALQREKILFFDLGVKNAILKQHRNIFTDTQKGFLFEQWFILQMLAYSSYFEPDWQFFYYRDDLQQEVDLVIDTGRLVLALEIKYSRKIQASQLSSLRVFKHYAKKPVKAFIIFRGDHEENFGDIRAIPYQTFLKRLLNGTIF